MSTTRIVIYGNAGSGKTTMARSVASEFSIPHLSLDDICWAATGVRLPLSERIESLQAFLAEHMEWVIDGCYGDLVEAAQRDARFAVDVYAFGDLFDVDLIANGNRQAVLQQRLPVGDVDVRE